MSAIGRAQTVLLGSAIYFKKALVVKQHSSWCILLSTTSHYCHCHPLRDVPSLYARVKGWPTFDPESGCSQLVMGVILKSLQTIFTGGSHPWNGIFHLTPFF